MAWFKYKIMNEKNCDIQQQTTTSDLQAPDFWQAHIECGSVKLVWKCQHSPNHTNKD